MLTLLALLALPCAGCGGRAVGTATLRARESHVWTVPPDNTRQPAVRSLAVGASNEVYALDSAGRVLVYAETGTLLRRWNMPDVSVGKPEGVTVLRDGHVVVSDTHYHRVVEFDATGGVVRIFGREGPGPGEFIYPVAVTVDPQENLYVAEYGSNDRVQVFTRDGVFVRTFGAFGTGPGDFQRPSGLVWHDGSVYVADAFNNRIVVYSDQGRFLRVLETTALNFPYDLKLDAGGALLVIEYGAGRLTRMTLDGRLLGRFGATGSALGQFSTPWGLALDHRGRVLVADAGNRRIVELILE